MRTGGCLLIALGIGLLGVALRLAVPVVPVDESFRDVIAFYRSLERP